MKDLASRLEALIPRLEGLRVMVVGDLLADRCHLRAYRHPPRDREAVRRGTFTFIVLWHVIGPHVAPKMSAA